MIGDGDCGEIGGMKIGRGYSTQIFYMIDEGDVPSIKRKMSLRERKCMRQVDGLSIIFTDFYVSVSHHISVVVRPCCSSLRSVANIQVSSAKSLDTTCLGLIIYVYTIQCGGQRNLVAPLLVYPLA
jgi:hypothetical protein